MTCILVLGQHRGGTSLMASLLHHLGVYMNPTSGDVVGENTFEDLQLQLLHEKMIRNWVAPRPYYFDDFRDEYEAMILDRSQRRLWGYKDPRLVFLFSDVVGVIQKYDSDIRVINVCRAPEESIASLMKTNPGMMEGAASSIIDRHVAAKDRVATRFMGPILTVQYRMILNTPEHHVKRIASFVGVDYDPGVCNIIRPELCHFKWEKM